jgi:hypothetical protein
MLSLSAHKYHNRYEFLADIERILENCILYNGKDSTYTQKAEKMVQVCRTTLDEVSVFLNMETRNLFLFALSFFLDTVSTLACIPVAWMERAVKVMVVAWFEVLSCNLLGGTEKKDKPSVKISSL